MYTVVINTRKGFSVQMIAGHQQAHGIYAVAVRTPHVRSVSLYGDAGLIVDERFPELLRGDKTSVDAATVLRNSGLHPKT